MQKINFKIFIICACFENFKIYNNKIKEDII